MLVQCSICWSHPFGHSLVVFCILATLDMLLVCFTEMSFLPIAFTQQLSCFSPFIHLCLSEAHHFLPLACFHICCLTWKFFQRWSVGSAIDSKHNKCNSMSDSCIIALLNEAQTCTAGGRQPGFNCATTLRAMSAITWVLQAAQGIGQKDNECHHMGFAGSAGNLDRRTMLPPYYRQRFSNSRNKCLRPMLATLSSKAQSTVSNNCLNPAWIPTCKVQLFSMTCA
jgi:hypothetical protein